jgi:4-amino-4-deoxy-L-arabinose transferase-like glycosyltransferase
MGRGTAMATEMNDAAAPDAPADDVFTVAGRRVPLAALIVVVEVIAVVVFGAITIQRYPLWSPVDEGAHFDNVIYVAAHGSYPVLGKTLASEQELAIGQGRYPRHTTINPRTYGLGGLSYEAFQPPLYYYVAAPVSLLSGNYHTKAILLRYFGLLLLVLSIALLARLSHHVLKRRWLLGLAGGLLVFLMPGVIVRMVTISDINLALPLATLTVTELWIAWERQSSRRLLLCGALVGCCVLTDLYLAEMVPVYALVAFSIWRRSRRDPTVTRAVAGGVFGAVIVSPWLVFNEIKYHALTASNIAKTEQLAIVNPQHVRYTLGQLPGLTTTDLFQPLMPQEWGDRIAGHAFYSYAAALFEVLLIPAAIVLALLLGRRLLSSGFWVLVLPWVCNIVLCWYIDIGQQWESGSMVPRYIYPTLAPLALFVVAGLLLLTSRVRPLLVTMAVATGFLVVLWVHLVPTIHTS